MPVSPIEGIGIGGVNKDTESVLLPLNTFTDARNVRFRNGSIETIKGEAVFRTLTGLSPEYGIHWARPDGAVSMFFNDGKVYSINGAGTETEYLNSVDAVYTDSKWQLDTFGGGYAVTANNGVATPRYSLYQSATADTSLIAFPGWNYGGLTVTAKVIRPLNYSLVAANLTLDTGSAITYAPSTIRVSVQAPIGSFPQVWEPGLTTDTADEFEVNTSSPIVDMRDLRGTMFIYSSDDIHTLSITGQGSAVKPYIGGYGVISVDCIAEFDGQHFVVDRNDIYIHSGSGGIKSVAEGKVKDYFINNINNDYSSNTFVKKNPRYNEIWVCFPNLDSTGKCNEALIFNYRNMTWTLRDLPDVTDMFLTAPFVGSSYLDGADQLAACVGTTNTFLMDSGYSMWDGSSLVPFESYVSREKVSSGNPSGDSTISSMFPLIVNSNALSTVSITVIGSNVYDEDIDFDLSEDRNVFVISPKDTSLGYKVDPRKRGRLLSFKIGSSDYWKLSFLALDITPIVNRR